jgi:hypothetical protein
MNALRTLLETAAVIGALALVGCSSTADIGVDAGTDAGCPAKDAGCPAKDAGCPAKDAGCPAKDAGCPAQDAGCPATTPGDLDTPPTGTDAEISAWIAKGDYMKGNWKCEAAPHPSRSPSPHGENRICSNGKLSAHGAGEFPIGSAQVKEIYEGGSLTAYATQVKLKAGGGEAWYWYEKLGTNVVANGFGVTLCTGCHSRAGTSTTGHDFVFTQVK